MHVRLPNGVAEALEAITLMAKSIPRLKGNFPRMVEAITSRPESTNEWVVVGSVQVRGSLSSKHLILWTVLTRSINKTRLQVDSGIQLRSPY
jgi:hypothetical protein